MPLAEMQLQSVLTGAAVIVSLPGLSPVSSQSSRLWGWVAYVTAHPELHNLFVMVGIGTLKDFISLIAI